MSFSGHRGIIQRHPVAKNIIQWAKDVREDPEIHQRFKTPGTESQLRVGDATYNPGSGVSHTEFLHLRAVWYQYPEQEHFDALFDDDASVGYKGYVHPRNRELASRICDKTRPPQWNEYFESIEKKKGVMQPVPDAGYFAMVRYWQELVSTHTKDVPKVTPEQEARSSKITKPAVMELSGTFSNLRIGGQPATPVKPGQSSKMPEGTPRVASYKPAKGNDANQPSADETYVNTALLLFLQAITKDLPGQFRFLHWAAPRIPLKLKDPNRNVLMEARIDGYLCRTETGSLNDVPLAICETKPFARSAGETQTQRQEAAEMACWIYQESAQNRANSGLLQSSASGKKRRLMISQDRHEIYIIVGEYGQKYEDYLRGTMRNTGPSQPSASIDAVLGSPTYLKRIRKFKTEVELEGWGDRETEVLNETTTTKPPPSVTQTAASQRPMRTKSGLMSKIPVAAGGPSKPKGAPLPHADEFLVMHRFGPFVTGDHRHMAKLIRRVVALLLQLRGPFANRADAFPQPFPGSQFLTQNESPKPGRSRSWPRREVAQLQESEKYLQDNQRKEQFRANPSPHPSKSITKSAKPKGG